MTLETFQFPLIGSPVAGGLPSAPAGDRNQCSAWRGRHASQDEGPKGVCEDLLYKIKSPLKSEVPHMVARAMDFSHGPALAQVVLSGTDWAHQPALAAAVH